MDCVGTVSRVEEGRAAVRVERGNCGECKGCGLFSRASREEVEFEVRSLPQARPGDRVVLRMPSGHLFRAYLLAFGVPVAAVPAAYLLGAYALAPLLRLSGQAAGVVSALCLGLAAFWAGLRLTRKLDLEPRMEAIVSYAEEDGCADRAMGDSGPGEEPSPRRSLR